MSQAKIYTLPEIQRINDARTAIPGHRYTDNFGNVWVGTNYRRLQVLSGTTAVWGNISGTLSDQSDLWLVLQSKQDLLVSGINIKTINGNTLLGSGNISIVGGVQSVTGLNTDNTDPLNPVVEISVDGITITGDGTPGNPLVSVGGGGSVSSVTDDGNGVVTVDNTNPSTPIIQFNGVNVDGITVTGDGTAGNPLVSVGGVLKGTASGTDTYTSTITGVTSYVDGDAYLIRFTNGNTTVSTLNINSLGAIPLFRNNDGQLIGGDISNGAEMLCVYNSTANNFQVIGTAPNTLLAYVTNDDSVTITKGMPVYAFSGTGDRMTVKRAYNTTDATSAQTVGLVLSTSIAPNQKGLIMMQGLLDGLSILPTATWNDGDPVYLGATAGTITKVKPHAPNHLVYLGFVTTASNGSAGRLYVRVQNGYELDELHNVQAQTPTYKDTLWYDNTVSPAQWKTASIPTILGYTPVSSVAGASPIASSGGTTPSISIADAVADGATKGAAAFTASDFNSVSGVISIDYANGQSASALNKGFLTSADWTIFNAKVATTRTITTSTPLSGGGDLSADRTISISDAVADGITKGAAAFAASDFNSTSGVISIDYTNGQAASLSNKGFLTSTDWNTFNGKQDALSSGVNIKTVQSTSIVGSGDVTITDANLSTSDITTNDVSITKHGFAPKAPNDTTKFLRGDATWEVPTFVDPEGWTTIVKSASQNVTGSTFVDDTDLQFSVVSGGNYLVTLIIATSGDSTANDYQFRFALSTGLMIGAGSAIHRNAVNTQNNTAIGALNAINTNAVVIGQNGGTISSGSGVITASGNYSFYVNSNATIKFQFACALGTTSIARTWKGSILKYKRLD